MENPERLIIRNVGIQSEGQIPLPLPHIRGRWLLTAIPIGWILLTLWISQRLSGNVLGGAWAIAGLICGVTFFIIGTGGTGCTIEVTSNNVTFTSWAGSAAWKRADIATVKTYSPISCGLQSSVTSTELVLSAGTVGAVVLLLLKEPVFWLVLTVVLLSLGGIPSLRRWNGADIVVYVSRKQPMFLQPKTISIWCKRDQAQSLIAALRSDIVAPSDPPWVKRLTNSGD